MINGLKGLKTIREPSELPKHKDDRELSHIGTDWDSNMDWQYN